MITKKELLKRIEILEASDKICEPRLIELDRQVKKLTEINKVLFDHLKIVLFVEEFINKKPLGESFVDQRFIIKNKFETDSIFNNYILPHLKNELKKSNGRKTKKTKNSSSK